MKNRFSLRRRKREPKLWMKSIGCKFYFGCKFKNVVSSAHIEMNMCGISIGKQVLFDKQIQFVYLWRAFILIKTLRMKIPRLLFMFSGCVWVSVRTREHKWTIFATFSMKIDLTNRFSSFSFETCWISLKIECFRVESKFLPLIAFIQFNWHDICSWEEGDRRTLTM